MRLLQVAIRAREHAVTAEKMLRQSSGEECELKSGIKSMQAKN